MGGIWEDELIRFCVYIDGEWRGCSSEGIREWYCFERRNQEVFVLGEEIRKCFKGMH